jgi:hypothetical protein
MLIALFFRNVKTFPKKIQRAKFGEGKYWIFKNTLFVKMEIAKLIKYVTDRHVLKLLW